MKTWFLAVSAVVLSVAAMWGTSDPALSDTCDQHYTICVNKYGNPPAVCACARAACRKAVGTADAGPKWNHLPGVNACFSK
jgi:hypothetical protein